MSRLLDLLAGTITTPPAFIERCVADDDELDAFVSALTARAVERGLTDPIPRGQAWLALREGWIHLPLHGSVEKLATA